VNESKEKTGAVEDLRSRLQWLMFFRVVTASFFLGIVAITQLQRDDSYLAPYLVHIYGLIGSVYILTFVYVFIISVIKDYKKFAYVQVMADLIHITVIIYITGGINSSFSFMYSLSIICASILLYMSGGIITATVSSLLYSCLMILQYYQMISPIQMDWLITSTYAGAPLYFPIVINVSAFYLVAFLGSFLAQQAQKSRVQLQEKQVDLEKLEALSENIIHSINSGLLTLDNERRIITFNRAAQEITGLVLSQVYMKPVEEVFPGIELHVSPAEEDMSNRMSNPRFEMPFARQDGKILQLGLSLSILRDNRGKEVGRILGFQNLTSIKEMQDYIQRMDRLAAVGRLAAGIAHEIRNPLASISGSVQVLKKSLNLNDADDRLMEIIIRESNNLSMLITDFTQFARPVKKDKERFKLCYIANDVVGIFKNSPECKNVRTVSLDIKDDLFIKANYQQFKQVLWNLMMNASQALENKAGEIAISARIREPGFQPVMNSKNLPEAGNAKAPRSWIEIQVEDTGCGIDEEAMDKIFDPFFTTKDQGIGLGLSIVYKIVQDHYGTISAKSTQGKGAAFSIYLPQ